MVDLVPEKQFFAQLKEKRFKPTDFVDGELRVWSYEGKSYTIPLPVAADSEQNFYCPTAIHIFFRHVMGVQSLIKSSGEQSYNVVPLIPNAPKPKKP
jgi:CRISPR/Cas system-associated exonuclease Cas4 (RecB family)